MMMLGGMAVLVVGAAYMDQPPVAHTGGFGEPTCLQCHFGQPLNAPGGALALQGLPERYEPGSVYPLTVVLARPGIQRGGFQLSVRYAEGASEGKQAGTLMASGDEVTIDQKQGIHYLQHTLEGTRLVAPDSLQWTFRWEAPDTTAGAIVFHVAANAANGDESAFDDYIYTLETVVR